jgi:hypothetical protein
MKTTEKSKIIPNNPEALHSELIKMIANYCNEKHPAVTIVFCKEQQASTNSKELEWYCNNHCAIHKSPFELICLDYSILEELKR